MEYTQKALQKLITIPALTIFFKTIFFRIHFYNFHVPHVQSFGCGPCGESFYTLSEQKDHHLWHRLSCTKYNCYKCNKPFDRLAGFTRHICVQPPIFQITEAIPDLTCDLCKLIFPTENLYYWHDCFIKNNGHCRKCKRQFVKKNILFKHVIHCKSIEPIVVEPATIIQTPVTNTTIKISREGGRQKIVKSEPGSILEIEDVSQIEIPDLYLQDELLLKKPVVVLERHCFKKKGRGRPKKIIKPIVVKNLKEAVEPSPEPLVLTELPIPESLTPIISSVTTLGIRIKQEVLSAEYGDFDANLARNIKKERTDEEKRKAKELKAASSSKPILKLKIKKEHGTLNASFVEHQQITAEVTSPQPTDVPEMPNDTTTPSTSTDTLPQSIKGKIRTNNKKKRIFKNPFAALAMKIKKERTETISVPVISQVGSAQDLVLPQIRKVQSMVRIKMEKPSPEHEVEYDYDEGGEGEWEEEEEENIPDSSVLNEPKKEINKSIPEILNSNELSSVRNSPEEEISEKVEENRTEHSLDNLISTNEQKLEENITELSPDNLVSTVEQIVEEIIDSVSSVSCIPEKLEENGTEIILTTTNEEIIVQRVEESSEENIVLANSDTSRAEVNESESIEENCSEPHREDEIIENNLEFHENLNNFKSEDVQIDISEKVQSPIEAQVIEPPTTVINDSNPVVENNSVEDESKTSSDVAMEEDSDQITELLSENNEKTVFNSKEMSSDVIMTEMLLTTTNIDEKPILNCLEAKMSPNVCSDVEMQEIPQLSNTNLEEDLNLMKDSFHDVIMQDSDAHEPTNEESSIIEISNVDKTVKNGENPNENFNHKIIKNHLNFPSKQLFNSSRTIATSLEESQQRQSENNILNNIHDLDDISSSSEVVENMHEIENNLLVGSPISSEPMSDGEEDKLLNDGCDTNFSLGKN